MPMYGFIRVASATPHIKVADCKNNANEIINLIDRACKEEVALLVLPELCVTGYTCGDLFHQRTLQKAAIVALAKIAQATNKKKITAVVGLPFRHETRLYNVAAVCSDGKVQGLVPKTFLPNYGVFAEKRFFAPAFEGLKTATVYDVTNSTYQVPFGREILFTSTENSDIQLGVEICEDGQAPISPSLKHVQNGALLIANLSASDEYIGKQDFRKTFVKGISSRAICAYIYANAGKGESSTDLVFAGSNMIAEDGNILAQAKLFADDPFCVCEIDTEKLLHKRISNTTYGEFLVSSSNEYITVPVTMPETVGKLHTQIDAYPFIPSNPQLAVETYEQIVNMMCAGLQQRLRHTNTKSVVVGISGGLDSTLALLTCHETFKRMDYDLKNIVAITMPCFGTTDRTYENACAMAKELGVQLREIPIARAVTHHFIDIGHDKEVHSATFENAQARERTQVLMDIANSVNGLVIGTGDLSEIALGWATYNGDHMSMYSLNASIPKTLLRHLVRFFEAGAIGDKNQRLANILHDVIETPVSPELVPFISNGESLQSTETILGSYDLHDFFLFYFVQWGFTPKKILFLAQNAFKCDTAEEVFSKEEIKDRLVLFIKRFFSQQFKRSCSVDGPKVTPISLSPRGSWIMPSDATITEWIADLEK